MDPRDRGSCLEQNLKLVDQGVPLELSPGFSSLTLELVSGESRSWSPAL